MPPGKLLGSTKTWLACLMLASMTACAPTVITTECSWARLFIPDPGFQHRWTTNEKRRAGGVFVEPVAGGDEVLGASGLLPLSFDVDTGEELDEPTPDEPTPDEIDDDAS